MTVRQYTVADLRRSMKTKSRGGLTTAEFYIKSLGDQFGRNEAANLFCNSKSVNWAAAIKQARSEFTFHEKGMDVLEVDDFEIDQGTKIDKGAYAEYSAVIGSNKIDHDGDIVDVDGYDFDMKAPALWMHAHGMPVGALKSVIDPKKALCRFKVADVPLGRDACKLMACGALRKSIGFKPMEFSPLGFKKDKDGRDVPDGWHVKRCKILEVSLVSVPANSDTEIVKLDMEKSFEKEIDAIRTLSGSFEDSRIKSWSKKIVDARPTVVRGWSASAEKIMEKAVSLASEIVHRAPEFATKDINDSTVQKYYGVDGYMPASMEDRCAKVASAVERYCRNDEEYKGMDCYCYTIATYSEMAYVVCRDYNKDTRKYMQFDYAMDSEGMVKITGTKKIAIQPVVVEVSDDDSKGSMMVPEMTEKLAEIEKRYKSKSIDDSASDEESDSDDGLTAISEFRKSLGRLLLGDEITEEIINECKQASVSLERLLNVEQLRAIVVS